LKEDRAGRIELIDVRRRAVASIASNPSRQTTYFVAEGGFRCVEADSLDASVRR
jgi:hypothetical protein